MSPASRPRYSGHGGLHIDAFTGLPRGGTVLGVTGHVLSAEDAAWRLAKGADIGGIGVGAILHHDFPDRALADPGFKARPQPLSREVLRAELTGTGLSDLALGAMQFGAKVEESDSFAILNRFVEAGGNLIDTANLYGAERLRRQSRAPQVAGRPRSDCSPATATSSLHHQPLGKGRIARRIVQNAPRRVLVLLCRPPR